MAVEAEGFGIFSPDCKTKTGCWLCPYFAVHADETDYWKLQSYLYVVSELRACSDDPVGVGAVHKPIVDRIGSAVLSIAEARPDLTERFNSIDQRVANGHVHTVYAELIQTYTMLNIL